MIDDTFEDEEYEDESDEAEVSRFQCPVCGWTIDVKEKTGYHVQELTPWMIACGSCGAEIELDDDNLPILPP